MTWLATRATLAKAHQSGDTWVFPVIRPVQWIYGFWLALGLAGALFGAVGPQGTGKSPQSAESSSFASPLLHGPRQFTSPQPVCGNAVGSEVGAPSLGHRFTK